MKRWPHQTAGVEGVLAKIEEGFRRPCLTSPTGGGKSVMMRDLAEHYLKRGDGVILYTNRVLLKQQMSDTLADAGFVHGLRGGSDECDTDLPFQIATLQTEYRRGVKTGRRQLHRAKLVLVDEGHLHTGQTAQEVFAGHIERDGAAVVFVTATPIGMAEVCDCMVQAGTTSELRHCGALVVAKHYGPDEPDVRRLKALKKGARAEEGKDLSEQQQRHLMNVPVLWGRVWEWFEKLNPEHHASILFAPGIGESIWFAEQFTKRGVRSAHIDGSNIWLDGELRRNSKGLRRDILDMSKAGEITVLCNRFVLREGIDAPWIRHGIFATIFGSAQTFIQSGGRLLRACEGKEFATVQDHGGNWWRHGSLNEDRHWRLEFDASAVYGLRADAIREGRQRRPWVCPKCGKVNAAPRCACGFFPQGPKPVPRPVLTQEGELKEMSGNVFRPRTVTQAPNGMRDWERIYWASFKNKPHRTFNAAEALFMVLHDWCWPDRRWSFMPKDPFDFHRPIGSVPLHRLILTPEQAEKFMPQDAAV